MTAATHNLVVRGPVANLWHYFAMAQRGEEPPTELAFCGVAGAGKSWGILSFFVWVAHSFPKVNGRVLICRDTRKSLTNSACVTLRKILYPGHPMLDGPQDRQREEYRFENWTFVLGGLEEPDRHYSTEWDFVYVQEAREIEKGPWEEFARGCRNDALYNAGVFKTPWNAAILDTNPDTPSHWIYRRTRGRRNGKPPLMLRFDCWLHDNPAYFDVEPATEKGKQPRYSITPKGEAYRRRMEKTTGTRYKRLVQNIWCSTEGAVWEEFSRSTHSVRLPRDADGWVSRETLKRYRITSFYAGMDLAFDGIACLLIAGQTRDNRLVVLHEVYRQGKDLTWWTARILEAHAHYPITQGFVDHQRGDWLIAWNDALGVPRKGPGSVFVKCLKGKNRGLELVRQRFSRAQPGGPTLLFDRACTYEHDEEDERARLDLQETGQPWCTVEEIPEYRYKRSTYSDDPDEVGVRTDEVDPACPNDGCDALEYLCTGVAYYEPESRLAEPVDRAYHERLRRMRHVADHPFEPYDPSTEDVTDDEAEDFIVDTIRNSLNAD